MKTSTNDARLVARLALGLVLSGWLVLSGVTNWPLRNPWPADSLTMHAPSHTPDQLTAAPSTLEQAAKARLREAYGKLPLSFEANQGQTGPQAKFLARGAGYTLFLTATEAVLQLQRADGGMRNEKLAKRLTKTANQPIRNPQSTIRNPQSAVVRMNLGGANPAAQVDGLEELPGRSNYFVGGDPSQWRANIAHYARVRYREVYPGIDLVYYGNQQQLEYDFIVAPGADPGLIKLSFAGVNGLRVDGQGDLVLRTGGGEVRQHKPMVWQEVDGVKFEVAGRYVINQKREVGFELADYDPSRPLVIDPVLSYSTYLGGGDNDGGEAIAVDSAGNVYVAGSTKSSNFPTLNPAQNLYGGGDNDVFVIKLNAAGSALIHATYIGGSGSEGAAGIALDASGNVYVTGFTTSSTYPTTPQAFQRSRSGGNDVFVTKLNATGSALSYSTYLGGSESDAGLAIAVDNAGSAYVTGETESNNFPTRNAFQTNRAPGTCRIDLIILVAIFPCDDAFVTKLDPTGSSLVYSSYLGGSNSGTDLSGIDTGSGITVDAAGNAYVTGGTLSNDFPTRSPVQATRAGSNDAFITKINPSGSLVYSTYLGGNEFDSAHDIVTDTEGNAYVTGLAGPGFPMVNALQGTHRGGRYDAFVAKLRAAGDSLVYSTYLGGNGDDDGASIAVDKTGSVYVTGVTGSTDFPVNSALQATNGGSTDAFVSKLNPTGNVLLYSTYLGGSSAEEGRDLTLDAADNAYVTGFTASTNFPIANPLRNSNAGGRDVFITKVDGSLIVSPAPPATITAESCAPGNRLLDPGETVTVNFPLRNFGVKPTANLVATLLPTGGVANPSGPQSYGVLAAGDPAVNRSYTFTVSGQCGGALSATLQLQDGTTNLGTASLTFPLGVPVGSPITNIHSYPGMPVSIPDNGTVEIPITVSDSGIVTDVNVRVRLNHSYVSDLAITLVGPDGTTVGLSLRNGVSGQNYGGGPNDCTGTFTVFDDAATTSIVSGAPPFVGRFRPEGRLANFNNKAANGIWMLRIRDAAASDTGTLGCWQIEITRQVFMCCRTECPAATGINPMSGAVGASVTITGANFTGVSTVKFVNIVTADFNIVSDTQISARVPAGAATGPITISKAGCADLQTGAFTVQPSPVPAITNLSPSSVIAGGSAFTLTVNGSNFTGGSIVRWNGNDRSTAFVSDTQLRGQISAGDISLASTASVTVFNPVPGGGLSNAMNFTVNSALANVSAASFLGAELAPESIVAAFGTGLATQTVVATDADPNIPGIQLPTELAGTTVEIKDSDGMARRAPLFFVSPTQINYQMPSMTASGACAVTIRSGDGKIAAGTALAARVAPGLFTANASGQGVAAGVALRVQGNNQTFEPIAVFDPAQNRFVARPIDLGPEGDQVFLILYGTGFRFRGTLPAVSVKIGGAEMEVLYAAEAPGFIGLDQLNVRLARSLMGRGEVDVVLTVDSRTANTVRIAVK